MPTLEVRRGCSFTLVDKSHAIQHVCSILNILHGAVVAENQSSQHAVSFNKHIPWLIDSLQALNEEQQRWRDRHDYSPVPLLRQALGLTHSSSEVDRVVLHKLDATIVLLSAEVAERPDVLKDEGQNGKIANRTLTLALVHLADISIKQRPVSRLVAAQLLNPLTALLAEAHLRVTEDLQVCLPLHAKTYSEI